MFSDIKANQQNITVEKKEIVSSPRKLIKILSIDGGGIRGLIPALILQNLESRLKNKQLAECFDVMAGTSTGGLIILMLNTPDGHGRPKYKAREISEIYEKFGHAVFDQSLWQYIKSLNGWIEAKYSSDALNYFLKHYFYKIKISQAISNILIPTYDIEDDKTFIFRKKVIHNQEAQDFYFHDVGLATCAAPTYFKPAVIKNLEGQEKIFIDGGIATNNPALIAYRYACDIYGKECDYILISIGTGTFFGAPQKIIQSNKTVEKGGIKQWMENNELISLILYAGSDIVDSQLDHLMKTDSSLSYFRFQSILDNIYTVTDNTSIENIKALKKYAYKIIENHVDDLNRIAQLIEGDHSKSRAKLNLVNKVD